MTRLLFVIVFSLLTFQTSLHCVFEFFSLICFSPAFSFTPACIQSRQPGLAPRVFRNHSAPSLSLYISTCSLLQYITSLQLNPALPLQFSVIASMFCSALFSLLSFSLPVLKGKKSNYSPVHTACILYLSPSAAMLPYNIFSFYFFRHHSFVWWFSLFSQIIKQPCEDIVVFHGSVWHHCHAAE